jgi:GntR family transcriptional regulator, carbon starvation induced regulator
MAIPEIRTLTSGVYRSIRLDILRGILVPGTKLGIDDLRRRYGAGSSPVREALSRLIAEGLVTAEEQKGFRVAPMSIREFREITDLRMTLESQALRQSIENGEDDWESSIMAAFHRLALAQQRIKSGDTKALDQWEERNREFHEALVGACGSTWLLRMRAVLQDHSRRYRAHGLAPTIRRDVHHEHEQIRDAVLGRDADKSCALMKQHFERTFEAYAKSQEKRPERTKAAS